MRITLIALCILLYGCKCEWYTARAIKKGCISKDTMWIKEVTPADTVEGPLKTILDTTGLYKLIPEKDSCVSRDSIITLIKRLPCRIKPINVDSGWAKLEIWSENGEPQFRLTRPRTEKKVPCPQYNEKTCPKDDNTWFWVAICVLGAMLAGSIFSRFKS